MSARVPLVDLAAIELSATKGGQEWAFAREFIEADEMLALVRAVRAAQRLSNPVHDVQLPYALATELADALAPFR